LTGVQVVFHFSWILFQHRVNFIFAAENTAGADDIKNFLIFLHVDLGDGLSLYVDAREVRSISTLLTNSRLNFRLGGHNCFDQDRVWHGLAILPGCLCN
jgi:hypothetical protein